MSAGSSATWPAAARWRRRSPVATGVATTLAVAVLTGIPTDVIPNPWFMRMTAAPWWTLPVFAATAVLSGLLAALMLHRPRACSRRDRAALGGGATLGWLAIGCPICNKLVVLALGFSGALTWFAPIQPVLALASLGVLLVGIALQVPQPNARRGPGSGGQETP